MIDMEKLKRIQAGQITVCDAPRAAQARENCPALAPVGSHAPVATAEPLGTLLSEFSFRGDTLTVFHHEDGNKYVALRPIAERLGLDWASQLRKIKSHEILASASSHMTTETANGPREAVALDITMLQGWLFSVNASKIREDLRATLRGYQLECFKALNDYYTKGYAVNTKHVSAALARTDFDPGRSKHSQTFDMVEVAYAVLANAAGRLPIRDRPGFLEATMPLLRRIYNAEKPEPADQDAIVTHAVRTGQSVDLDDISALTRSTSPRYIVARLQESGLPLTRAVVESKVTVFHLL